MASSPTAGRSLIPREHLEKLISGLGAFLGILTVFWLSGKVVGPTGTPWIVSSMAATAVLVFAVPHGPLSQPWPVLGSHVIAALIGVTAARFLPMAWLAASLAVGISIVVMYYLNCIHPPGGATALTAVLGGTEIHNLGYHYVVTPVLLNAVLLLIMGVLLNWWFPWRRYPAAFQSRPRRPIHDPVISHAHLAHALNHMGSFIDVTEDDLAEIYHLARQHAQGTHLAVEQIQLGRCYSNGETGDQYCVRGVIDESPDRSIVIFRTLVGPNRRRAETCPRTAFALWAKHEVPVESLPPASSRITNTPPGRTPTSSAD